MNKRAQLIDHLAGLHVEQAEDFGIFDARAYVEGLLRPPAAEAS